MSKIEVDAIVPRTGNNLTVGSSGQTIIVPAGATFNASDSTFTLPDGSIVAAKIASGAITADKIASSIDLSSKTVTLPASAVTQHVTPFDDNKIVNDISTLALRQASDANRSAYSTNSSFVDVFQDDNGIDTETNTDRNTNEFVSSIISSIDNETVFYLDSTTNATTPPVVKDASGTTYTTTTHGGGLVSESGNVGTYAVRWGGVSNDWYRLPHSTSLNLDGDFCIDYFVKFYSQTSADRILSKVASGPVYSYYMRPQGQFSLVGRMSGTSNNETLSNNVWYYIAYDVDGSNLNIYVNGTRTQQVALTGTTSTSNTADLTFGGAWGDASGTQIPNCAIEGLRLKKGSSRYSSASSITVPTQALTNIEITSNATGNFTGTTITAPSSVSSMGAIITYQDQSGTNALNTDIVLQLSADGGSNYSTATLTALPDFSTGIKMAKINDLAVTAGTQLKYKISFANQASGTKEARIRGVALQY